MTPSVPGSGFEPVVRFDINDQGERGGPLPADVANTYRVLVAGGSAVECSALDQDSAWPALLQSKLNEPHNLDNLRCRHVHVGNIGRSLTPASAVCNILERTLPRYERLDLLVLLTGASDVLEWLESGTPAIWPRENGYKAEFGEHPGEEFSWRKGQFACRRWLETLWRRYGQPIRQRADLSAKLLVLRRRRREATEWVAVLPDPEPILRHFATHLRRAIEIGRRKGARVVLARQPWFDRPLTPEEDAVMWNFCCGKIFQCEDTRIYYSHAAVRSLLAKMDQRLMDVAQELGVETVQLRASVEPNLVNFYDFMHFTAAGAKLVADSISRTVLGQTVEADLHSLVSAVDRGRGSLKQNHATAAAQTAIMVEHA